jgi:hypothetical protein
VRLVLVAAERDSALAFEQSPGESDGGTFSDEDFERYEAMMEVFEADDAVHVGKHFEAVQAIVGPSVPDREQFWDGDVYGDDDRFGPVSFTSPTDAARIVTQFEAIDYQLASDRYEAAFLLDGMVYPAVWAGQGDADESKAESITHAMAVIAPYTRAAARGLGILARLEF